MNAIISLVVGDLRCTYNAGMDPMHVMSVASGGGSVSSNLDLT